MIVGYTTSVQMASAHPVTGEGIARPADELIEDVTIRRISPKVQHDHIHR
jgi:hypothetical protein